MIFKSQFRFARSISYMRPACAIVVARLTARGVCWLEL